MAISYVAFEDGDRRLLAFGEDPSDMPVYQDFGGGWYERIAPGIARYPGILRFLPYATSFESGQRDTVAQVKRRFGSFKEDFETKDSLEQLL